MKKSPIQEIKKSPMQELKETIQEMINNGGNEDLLSVIAHIDNKFLKREKEEFSECVNRMCDLYGHFRAGEQMYNHWYIIPELKPMPKEEIEKWENEINKAKTNKL